MASLHEEIAKFISQKPEFFKMLDDYSLAEINKKWPTLEDETTLTF